MDFKLVINRLDKEELIYELRVRGVTGLTTVEEMRKSLRNLMKLEKKSPMRYPTHPFTFAEDCQYVTAKVGQLSDLIKGFDEIEDSNLQEKISSKLVHLFERASRAIATKDEEYSQRQQLILTVMNLQSDFKSRGRKLKRRSQSLRAPVELAVHMSTPNSSSCSESDSSDESVARDARPSVSFAPISRDESRTSKTPSVPVYKWQLTKFDGKKSTISLCAFLEQVEELRVSRNVSFDELFRSAGDLFTGKAKVWHNGTKGQVNSWEELVRELRLQYLGGDVEYNKELLKEIKQRSQHPDESIGIFIACMNTLFNRLTVPVNDRARLDILLENLAPYYKRELGMVDIRSVEQLLQLGRRAEANKRAIDAYIPPPRHKQFLEPDLAYVYSEDATSSVTTTNTDAVTASPASSVVCWNCRAVGHRARQCTAAKTKYCFKCGTANHTVKTCPKCAPGNAK